MSLDIRCPPLIYYGSGVISLWTGDTVVRSVMWVGHCRLSSGARHLWIYRQHKDAVILQKKTYKCGKRAADNVASSRDEEFTDPNVTRWTQWRIISFRTKYTNAAFNRPLTSMNQTIEKWMESTKLIFFALKIFKWSIHKPERSPLKNPRSIYQNPNPVHSDSSRAFFPNTLKHLVLTENTWLNRHVYVKWSNHSSSMKVEFHLSTTKN